MAALAHFAREKHDTPHGTAIATFRGQEPMQDANARLHRIKEPDGSGAFKTKPEEHDAF